jgi:hypothetical protein
MGNRIVWKVLNKKQQEKILDEHRRWWEGNGGKQADLSLANLRGADLNRANLRGADLNRADLSLADLSLADLNRADLRGADLRGADLSLADLNRADLRLADLRGADLSLADLNRADLRGAKLKGALTIKATYQCGPQGNRYDVLVAFLCSDGEVYFSTGYIHAVGKKEFLAMVRGTHSDNDHAKKYALAVAHCVKMLESE